MVPEIRKRNVPRRLRAPSSICASDVEPYCRPAASMGRRDFIGRESELVAFSRNGGIGDETQCATLRRRAGD